MEGIDRLSLVSQKDCISGDFSNVNDSTRKKLLRIARMLEKEMVKCLGDFLSWFRFISWFLMVMFSYVG